MSVLWIALVDVKDPDIYGNYVERASEAIAAHGGEFLARGGKSVHLEGHRRPRNVVIRFPSFDDALACYHSEKYAEALAFAKVSAERDMVIVEEL